MKPLILTIGSVLILSAIALGGFYLGRDSYKKTPGLSPTVLQPKACTQEAKICPDGSAVGRTGPNCEFAPCPTAPKTKTLCQFGDESFCQLVVDLKNIVAGKDSGGIINQQTKEWVTCLKDQPFNPIICEGAPDGEKREGYTVGYNQSEGNVYSPSGYKEFLEKQLTANQFSYHDAVVDKGKGIVVFLTPDKNQLLVFPVKKTNDLWKINYLLVGGVSDDYLNLTKKVLENVTKPIF